LATVEAGERLKIVTMKKNLATTPVEPGNFTGATPEFGRLADVQRLYGLKRGTCYNLLRDGKIRGCLLRVRGKKSGCRLIEMSSVRNFIRSQMDEPEAES
jgi:hypothetical protein